MNPSTPALVQASFAQVQTLGPQVATLFYARLFEIDPDLRRLFKSDLGDQGQRLLAMLGQAVALLDRPERLLPVLRQLGARHQGYGVQASHYTTVGQALLDTLAAGLGPAFTPALRAAWTEVYGVVAQTMQAGAREALPA
ncbi:globin family protein [Inhella proteolytica]|uniref:Hemin receptor n=1 Tax=Inhella proteolytica TaxID=2795029 RepID=A0A931JA64_9BURK|nr:globin family protein [Inhella proteolytica]MBH9579642.1 hemin receptor [Inhella proteolytica]